MLCEVVDVLTFDQLFHVHRLYWQALRRRRPVLRYIAAKAAVLTALNALSRWKMCSSDDTNGKLNGEGRAS